MAERRSGVGPQSDRFPTNLQGSERPAGPAPATAAPLRAAHAAVASDHPLASAAGVGALKAGGNAIDAACATALALGVLHPESSGIGGGAFMLFHNGRTRLLTAYDGRETAPAAAKADRFLEADGKPQHFFEALVGG